VILLGCHAGGRQAKGSRINKLTILGVEAPVWQGAKTQEYLDIPSFRNAAGRDASSYKTGGMHHRIKQVGCIGV
jgi:hypothetical protein